MLDKLLKLIKKIFSLHTHTYGVINVEPYTDISYGGRVSSTRVIVQCTGCGVIQRCLLYGITGVSRHSLNTMVENPKNVKFYAR